MRFDALQITQPSGRQVYAFATTADALLGIVDIPRICRNDTGDLIGYQRPEVVGHISEIRQYLNGDDAILPNTLVVAFDNRVSFTPHKEANGSLSHYGSLNVPDVSDGQSKPGFVVDGQQRLAAIASCRHEAFPVFVTALVVTNVEEQRKQFVLVNRTKPLPQGLIFELLPEIDGVLPEVLSRQRLAAAITTRLNLDKDSVLYQSIKSPTCPGGSIKDNSVRRMVMNSLSDGVLFDLMLDEPDEDRFIDSAIPAISTFWSAVAETFPSAWNLPPERSRLTHGVGVAAMGYVMDHIYLRLPSREYWSFSAVSRSLGALKQYCAWTEGSWDFGRNGIRRWNELQNIDRDIRMLTNYFRQLLEEPDRASQLSVTVP